MPWDRFCMRSHIFCLWEGRLYLTMGLLNGKWHKLWLLQAMICFKCSHCTYEAELSSSRVNDKLNRNHQYGLASKKALVRPYTQFHFWFWDTWYKKDIKNNSESKGWLPRWSGGWRTRHLRRYWDKWTHLKLRRGSQCSDHWMHLSGGRK